MRLILNEIISKSVVRELRAHGHDVLSVQESMCGADDATILARAQAESRSVVTQDKDFGELAFRCGLPAQCGVILFRLAGANPQADNRRVLQVIASRTDWAGQFTVAIDARLRMRPLPSANQP